MMEMSRVAGERDQLITLLLPLAEHVLDIILVHFREGCVVFFLTLFSSLDPSLCFLDLVVGCWRFLNVAVIFCTICFTTTKHCMGLVSVFGILFSL